MADEPTRAAFEAYYRIAFGAPGYRFRSGMETVPADYENAFLWFDRHPRYPDNPPQYYHGDIQQKYVLFRAGWSMRAAQAPSQTYEFLIKATGLDPTEPGFEGRFSKLGCNDVTIAFQKGLLHLDFAREAESYDRAVQSAIEDVQAAGGKIVEIGTAAHG